LKFIEFCIGNNWLIRTETELEDGSEFEEKGIIGPIRLHSIYLRFWIGNCLYTGLKEGLKRVKKSKLVCFGLFLIKDLRRK
jgi:hypothetical protein